HHRSVAPAAIDLVGNRSNACGISDLIGNVWEWCAGYRIDSLPTVASFILKSRQQMIYEHAGEPALRGGSFLDDLSKIRPFLPARMLKKQGQTRHSDLGFRIMAEIPVNT